MKLRKAFGRKYKPIVTSKRGDRLMVPFSKHEEWDKKQREWKIEKAIKDFKTWEARELKSYAKSKK